LHASGTHLDAVAHGQRRPEGVEPLLAEAVAEAAALVHGVGHQVNLATACVAERFAAAAAAAAAAVPKFSITSSQESQGYLSQQKYVLDSCRRYLARRHINLSSNDDWARHACLQ
jgi:hypothetical protein